MEEKLLRGNNIELLKTLEDNSVDSVVTDPPYGLSFMNKKWDYDVPSVDFWKEVYRVLKPGGHILSFGGTRTYHRMVVNIEDAGFEIRDQIMWLYGSGFPKSHNIGKAVDKLQGVKIEKGDKFNVVGGTDASNGGSKFRSDHPDYVKYQSQNEYDGWGTALKPANEPICVARKPLSEKSVAENVLRWGTGGINIDGCRIGTDDNLTRKKYLVKSDEGRYNYNNGKYPIEMGGDGHNEGRFPANLILECICDEVIKGEKGEKKPANYERTYNDNNPSYIVNSVKSGEHYNDKGDIHTNPNCPCYLMDEQSGISKSSKGLMKSAQSGNDEGRYNWNNGDKNDFESVRGHNDKGGASRFFYQAKVSKAERNMGLEHFEDKTSQLNSGGIGRKTSVEKRLDSNGENAPTTKNSHPTVKPVSLMAYLCRLVTPPNGIVLDPFMGSGSTGIAAQLEGFNFIGMEMDEEYFNIAQARINNYNEYKKFIK
jgi:DNA modification methylase